MYQYIHGLLKEAPEVYKGGSAIATSASINLYKVRIEDRELLSNKERDEYHSLTAQCLYLSKRARPDLQQSIAFHRTIVKV